MFLLARKLPKDFAIIVYKDKIILEYSFIDLALSDC